MQRIHRILAATALALLAPLHDAHALNTATADLTALDKSLASGWLDARIEFYAPPDAKGNAGTPKVYPAQLLFARPGQFKLVLRAGAKDEYRAACSNGLVSWIDMATGFASKDTYDNIVDPFTRSMLDVAGAISRFAPAKEIAVNPQTPLRGAKLTTRTYGSSVVSSKAWFNNDHLTGFEFLLSDNSRVFVSVLSFKQNVATKASDFTL